LARGIWQNLPWKTVGPVDDVFNRLRHQPVNMEVRFLWRFPR